ncbi:GIY-YIG nuclease family protein [uncultured Maricaulis sp.]|uniref:GIY-YIG nuclease family protein n=1 Tax=uncultured Maricaulis sp. TaxID=174710 RepID=UPI0030DB5134
MQPCVYMLASRPRGALYIGVTGDIAMRVWMHREGRGPKFCARYQIHDLVWLEFAATLADAITREKRLKNWRRAWKIELVEKENPRWRDLYEMINQ